MFGKLNGAHKHTHTHKLRMKEKEEQAYEEGEGGGEGGRQMQDEKNKNVKRMSCCLCNREIQELLYTCGARARFRPPNRFHLAVSLLFLLLLMMFSSHLFCYYYYFAVVVVVLFFFISFSLFFRFDFVECEIIIKIVGVYFVCSELYNLHESLGKRFCSLTHTRTSHNWCLSEMVVSSPMTYVKCVNVSLNFMCGKISFIYVSRLKDDLGLEFNNVVNAIWSNIHQIWFLLASHLLLVIFVYLVVTYTVLCLVYCFLFSFFSLDWAQWRFNWFCRCLKYEFSIFIKFYVKCEMRIERA